MNLELEYGRTFKYSAFMEFSYMRRALKNLVVVSQMNCEAFDDARLNMLREVQRSNPVQVQPEEMEPGKTYYIYNERLKTYSPFVCQKKCQPGDLECKSLKRKRIVKVRPQSILTVGGGPSGLMATIHCAENVLATGGTVQLNESRDAFAKGGATFERAQIVRLDARWIAMMRYHLGTIFEVRTA